MTLDDIEGHSRDAGLIKGNSTSMSATFSTVVTDTARRAVPRRLRSFFVSNSTRKLLSLKITKMLIAVLKIYLLCYLL